MCFNFCGIRFEFKFLFFAAVTLLLFIDRSGVALCAFLSSAAHELAHLAALFSVRANVTAVTFELFGIRIDRMDALLFWEELAVLMAGPTVNLVLFLLCGSVNNSSVNLIAAVNLSIGLFNLLPVGALDGGKAANLIFVRMLGESKGKVASLAISLAVVLPIIGVGLYLAVQPMRNVSLLVVGVFLVCDLAAGFWSGFKSKLSPRQLS